jgi:penicillin-binding protein 2
MFYQEKENSWLFWFARGLLIILFLVLFARVFELQIVKGSYYRSLSDNNRIRRVEITPPRGRILARGGEVLADNLEVPKRIIFDSQFGYLKSDNLEGVSDEDKVLDWKRKYSLSDKAGHITGYLGEVTDEEVGKINPDCPEKGPLKSGGLVGRGGLEQYYDCILSGVAGEKLIEVDITGKKVRVLGEKKPIAGQDLKTTIDYELQKKVAELMDGKRGAVIVTDPKGQVLSLYSSPSFDPNWFIEKDSVKIGKLLKDDSKPLFNRAISGIYHPGSTFKPFVSLAALEEGKIDKDFRYEDKGEVSLETPYGVFKYGNWYFSQYGGVEGNIDLKRALARSTDTFFYKVGELLGIDNIVKWAKIFGFDSKTGIDIPSEVKGLIPDPEWKLRVKGESWFLGNTYHFSIGQGDLAVTPAELTQATASIANGGYLCKLHFSGNEDCRKIDLKEENLKLVKEAMVAVCKTGGTAYPFFDFPYDAACKTGTAETGKENVNHAWFIFFTPVENPEIVVTVFVEEGGEGSKEASPIGRKIADFWFARKNNQLPKND